MKIFVIGGTTVSKEAPHYGEEIEVLRTTMRDLGKNLIKAGHDLLVCSPFEGAADLEVVRGAASVLDDQGTSRVEFYYPETDRVRKELSELRTSLAIPMTRTQLFACAPPTDENSRDAWPYAWLLAQLRAYPKTSIARIPIHAQTK